MGKRTERKETGHPFGLHRVLDKKKCLPQEAERIDNSLPIYSNEILIEVDRLNIDAASFVQMEKELNFDLNKIGQTVFENTRIQGKQHNRVTGSGGMLTGKVVQIGSKYKGPLSAKVGDSVATLVSLTLTPLHLEKIISLNKATHQIEAKGHAILFERSIAAPLPKDIHPIVATAVYDVAGAPATVFNLVRKGQTVLVIGGGGKAGTLSCFAARKKMGKAGKIFAIEPHAKAAEQLRNLKVCNEVFEIDATNSAAVLECVRQVTKNKGVDVVVNVASVPGTENSGLLSVKEKGTILFFGMATSFSKVALGAEALAVNAKLLFGNGYFPKHDRFSIQLLRAFPLLKALFYQRNGLRP